MSISSDSSVLPVAANDWAIFMAAQRDKKSQVSAIPEAPVNEKLLCMSMTVEDVPTSVPCRLPRMQFKPKHAQQETADMAMRNLWYLRRRTRPRRLECCRGPPSPIGTPKDDADDGTEAPHEPQPR